MSDAHVVRADRSASLQDRLVLLRHLVSGGDRVTFEVTADDVPVAAVVTAAVEAGAAEVVAVGDGSDQPDFVRDLRRARHVATALAVERSGLSGGRR